jgi:hypothetical protein
MKHVLPRFASPVKPFGPSNTGPLLPNQLSLSVENPILQREPNGRFRRLCDKGAGRRQYVLSTTIIGTIPQKLKAIMWT